MAAWLSRAEYTREMLVKMPLDFFVHYGRLLDPTGFLTAMGMMTKKIKDEKRGPFGEKMGPPPPGLQAAVTKLFYGDGEVPQ